MNFNFVSWFGLIPITIILMGFITKEDLNDHTEKICFGLLLSLVIYLILYFLLIYVNFNKWLSLTIAMVLWIISFFMKRNIYG
jgi:ABC-type transport system involved in multi-copper enzyme maturation permease subunit